MIIWDKDYETPSAYKKHSIYCTATYIEDTEIVYELQDYSVADVLVLELQAQFGLRKRPSLL